MLFFLGSVVAAVLVVAVGAGHVGVLLVQRGPQLAIHSLQIDK